MQFFDSLSLYITIFIPPVIEKLLPFTAPDQHFVEFNKLLTKLVATILIFVRLYVE